ATGLRRVGAGATVIAVEIGEDVDRDGGTILHRHGRGAIPIVVRPGVLTRGQVDRELPEDREGAGFLAVDEDGDRLPRRIDAGAAAVREGESALARGQAGARGLGRR